MKNLSFFLVFLLRQDLGLQGTSLNDILYKNASFLNLVDPISHELLLSLARDLQCPKRVRKEICLWLSASYPQALRICIGRLSATPRCTCHHRYN